MSIEQTLSLYVPRVAEGTPAAFVADFMRTAGYGDVSRVDINPLSGSPGQAEMFVHFAAWFDTPPSRALQGALADGGSHRVYPHADSSYWCLNRARNPMSHTERRLEDRIAALEELVEMQATHFDDELARRDNIIEQLLARVLAIDEPADYAPGERTVAERARLLEIDPLHEIPESESELPLAPRELELRRRYETPAPKKSSRGRRGGRGRKSGRKA